MAQGTLILFDELAESIGDGRIDLDDDNFYIAFTTLSVTGGIGKTNAIPCWGSGGSTNLNTNEVVAGGGYTAEGKLLAGVTWAQTGGVGKFDANDVVWTSSASGDPETIKSAVIYSDTATNKDCLGFIDMTEDAGTTAISLLTGDITVAFNAGGIFTLTNP